MTNVLIPTDFSVASLQMAGQAINALDLKNANIILFHAFNTPSLGIEMLGASRKPYADLFNDIFRHNCKLFREQHPKAVQKIFIKFMNGDSPALFRNFIDANEIDLIYCPEDYQFVPVHNLSVDPRPLFKKCGIEVVRTVKKKVTSMQVKSTTTNNNTNKVALATS